MKTVMKTVIKDWGSEVWFVNNDLYCGKELTIAKGKKSSKGRYHFHKIKDETFYIISGILILEDGEGVHYLSSGDSYRIYPGVIHRFTTDSDECVFIEVSTHHDDEDSYRIDGT